MAVVMMKVTAAVEVVVVEVMNLMVEVMRAVAVMAAARPMEAVVTREDMVCKEGKEKKEFKLLF